jgi:hypothetical protein
MLLSFAARIPGEMPLVPLYDESSPAQSSHNVRAPGGYETWRIVALDKKQNLLLVASLWNGYLLDPAYASAYRRYIKHPTRTPPPLPSDYACQELALYQSGKRLATSLTRLASIEKFPAIPSNVAQFSMGSCHLIFQPLSASNTLDVTTLTSSHHWLFSNALGQLRGELNLAGGRFSIDALAVQDHRYGAAPLEVPQWLEGCAFFSDHVLLFQATSTTSWLVETASSSRLIDQPLTYDALSSGPWMIGYPRSISLPDRASLINPRIIDSSPVRLRLMYEVKSATHGETGHAFVEIFHPHRLRNPILSFFSPRPCSGLPPITWSPIPPTDKSSPSAPAHAHAPSSSP